MDRRPQPQPHALGTLQQPIRNEDRVLQMGHQHPFFEPIGPDVVPPDRQARFELEFTEPGFVGGRVVRKLLAIQLPDVPVGEDDFDRQVIEHHQAAKRDREGGNQQPVITPRAGARHRAGRVTPQAVRHQPLVIERPRIGRRRSGAGERTFDHFLRHRSGPFLSGRFLRSLHTLPRGGTQHDRRFGWEIPSVRRLDGRRRPAAVTDGLTCPHQFPAAPRWRSQQRFGRG